MFILIFILNEFYYRVLLVRRFRCCFPAFSCLLTQNPLDQLHPGCALQVCPVLKDSQLLFSVLKGALGASVCTLGPVGKTEGEAVGLFVAAVDGLALGPSVLPIVVGAAPDGTADGLAVGSTVVLPMEDGAEDGFSDGLSVGGGSVVIPMEDGAAEGLAVGVVVVLSMEDGAAEGLAVANSDEYK
jgi:hypothetical protein